MSAPQPAVMERRSSRRVRFADFFELTKPGITTMVLITTLVGYYMASRNGLRPLLLLHTILGTALVAGGASGLNQYFERDLDARMHRTRNRPLPAGRLFPNEALFFSMIISVVGVADLMFFVNVLTGVLGLMTLAAYIFVYTPLKTRTALCTLIGAFPGATPPVMGWTAAGGDIDAVALSLFAILFLWQMPHFFAIAWMCTEDYARGGFSVHVSGQSTGRQIIFFCCALIPISVLPTMLGLTGMLYLLGAILLGFVYLGYGFAVALFRSHAHAYRLLWVSILYLPALLALMMLDKV
ncbi:MAG: protoheme IX farnesyltransferase [Acidobacteria bacterium 13_1_20CM_2_57_8]|nr:MAG: protoheme IX farnesyltransferase [Acidobacteria bacterium 13_1_20CM_2_57_8]